MAVWLLNNYLLPLAPVLRALAFGTVMWAVTTAHRGHRVKAATSIPRKSGSPQATAFHSGLLLPATGGQIAPPQVPPKDETCPAARMLGPRRVLGSRLALAIPVDHVFEEDVRV